MTRYPKRSPAVQLEQRQAFDVVGLRKQVDGLDLAELVASLDQQLGVAGQGGRVAGDVEQFRDLKT